MSPAVRLLRARLERRVAAFTPDVRMALIRGFERIQENLSPATTRVFIADGQLAALIEELDVEGSFTALRQTLRDGVEAAAKTVTKELPTAQARAGIIDVLKPDAVEGIRQLNSQVMQGLDSSTREAVRAYVEQGLRSGLPPATIARDLRAIIGLAPKDVEAVANFRRMLEEKDAAALTRLLRDRRYDGTIKKAFAGDGLSPAQIDKMVEAYTKKAVAHHAETIARTASNDAQKLAMHLAYSQAVARGDIPSDSLTKRWSGTLDDRERPSHLLMEGETVQWNHRFSNGQMLPGESEYGCRCVPIYSTTAKPRPGAGAAGITPDDLRVGERLRGV